MRSITATTTAPASQDAGAAATLFSGSPEYAYAGEGRWLPANEAAHEECRRFNAWVDEVNARASKGLPQ